MQDNIFTVINDDGTETENEILFTFKNDNTGKNYMAYTDNTLDEDGNTKVYLGSFIPEESDTTLYPIETQEEWDYAEMLFNMIMQQSSEDDTP